jgi:hypothetical protein
VDNIAVDALVAKVRDLVQERAQMGLGGKLHSQKKKAPSILSIKDVVKYLDQMNDADQVADP